MLTAIAEALDADENEGALAAGFVPHGYRVVPESEIGELERLPFADELEEAGWDSEDVSDSVRQEVIDFLRFKRDQALRDRQQGKG